MRIINPEYLPHKELALTDEAWNDLKAGFLAFLRANAHQSTISEADARGVDPLLLDSRIFNQVLVEFGVDVIPDRP